MTGWKIVCPDGKERHYPYNNRGDAVCDATVFNRQCVTMGEDRCPGGKHDVCPCVFTPPQPTGEA